MAPGLTPAPADTETQLGYWSPRTATIDWCEDNYQVSWYIAEFHNTVSNLAMIIPAIYGSVTAYKRGLETRFIILHLLFLIVGLGSTVFHMTLKHSMQLLDEVPMIWGSCYMLYCMHLVREKPGTVNKKLAIFLLAYCIAFVIVYLLVPNPAVFQSLYGTVVVVMIVQAALTLRAQFSRQILSIYSASVLFYLAAFILWNLDNHYCDTLISIRSNLPSPLKTVFQFHAIWHVLAGYATYLNIQHCLHHRLTYLQRKVTLSADWCGLCVQTEPESNHENNNNDKLTQ